MKMTVLEANDDITHVKLSGMLDLKGVEELDLPFTAGIASRRKPAIVDMSDVSFLSSLGIRLLLSNAKALSRSGASMVLYAVQPDVANVLICSGLDQVLPLVESAEEARTRVGLD